jgi:diketogulonate reductase-like aldo/keto reductase
MAFAMWKAVENEAAPVQPGEPGEARQEGRSTAIVETFATLHRALTLGVHLLDTADMYTWGLHREFAAFRTTYAAQLAAAAEEPIVPRSKVVEIPEKWQQR